MKAHGRRIAALLAAGTLAVVVGLVLAGGQTGPSQPVDRPLRSLDVVGEPLRIVAFGTSLTAYNAWPDRLQATLSDCLGQAVVIVRVAGDGRGSAWALDQIGRVRAQTPDLVLIEFAINDADLRDGVSPRRSLVQHDRLVTALRAELPMARLMLMTTSPVWGPMRRLQRPFLARYYRNYRILAQRRDLGLADLTPRWRSADVPKPADGLHPGDAATARIMVPALTRLVATAAGGCAPVGAAHP